MQNTPINFEPAFLGTSAANILNGAVTSMAGPVGITLGQPYLLITHIRLTNNSGSAVTGVYLYKGATGGSTAGTEFGFANVTIPANSYVEWYGRAKFISTDFLTGKAGTASAVTITIDGEAGFATA